jgi:hypothetical protein
MQHHPAVMPPKLAHEWLGPQSVLVMVFGACASGRPIVLLLKSVQHTTQLHSRALVAQMLRLAVNEDESDTRHWRSNDEHFLCLLWSKHFTANHIQPSCPMRHGLAPSLIPEPFPQMKLTDYVLEAQGKAQD